MHLPTLASLAEEAVAMEWRKGDAVRQGAVFTGHNENSGRRWSTKCTVIARWQYDIVAADDGCRVTEST
jgi:hypothetical protein